MYPGKFEYFRASSVSDAIALLGQHKDSKLIAGGHSLLPLMKLRLANPAALIDIGRVEELRGIREDGSDKGIIIVGGLTTHYEIESSELLQDRCPILPEAAAMIGDLQVRNRGTIGGSLSHADPAADMPAVMLALGAQLVATGPKGSRTINADDFFTGLMQTALAENEILTEVRVPAMKHGAYVKYPHLASRYAVVGVAVVGTEKDDKVDMVRIGVTGASAHAYRPMTTEMMMNGKTLATATITEAAKHAADGVTMNSDLVASASYRAHLVVVYTKRALMKLHERMM